MNKKIFVAAPALTGNEKKYVNDCLDSTWISSAGKYINQFESEFAKYVGIKHAISCSNGTVALHVPLLALGIGPGDEVIVPTLTYIATANAVEYVHAKKVLVDCDPITWAIDINDLKKKISPKTKAIMVVHLYGHPADMDPIIELASKYNIHIIEDCAESIGATYTSKKTGETKMTGSYGIISTFSFFGNKVITTGEGGMIVTNDDSLNEKMRILKGQGMDPKRRYWHPVVGYNYRMTNIQAAIGLAQLEQVEQFLSYRRKLAGWYNTHLASLKDFIVTPYEADWAKHCYWMYSILIKNANQSQRDEMMSHLANQGIETRPIFYPMHQMPPHFSELSFPNADRIAAQGINLPTHVGLTEDDVIFVCEKIKDFFHKK